MPTHSIRRTYLFVPVTLVAVIAAGAVADPPQGPIVATLLDAAEVEWVTPPLVPGDEMKPGVVQISRGRFELLTVSGVMIQVSGPATIDLQNPMSVKVMRGKMSVTMPEAARGFTIIAGRISASLERGEAEVEVDAAGGATIRAAEPKKDADAE